VRRDLSKRPIYMKKEIYKWNQTLKRDPQKSPTKIKRVLLKLIYKSEKKSVKETYINKERCKLNQTLRRDLRTSSTKITRVLLSREM